ncbi:hypothetical protein MTO96_009914 [Rhipicephalus appendiculatus]
MWAPQRGSRDAWSSPLPANRGILAVVWLQRVRAYGPVNGLELGALPKQPPVQAVKAGGWLGALSLSPGFSEESLTAVCSSLQASFGQWRCPRNSLVLRLGGWFFRGARLGRCCLGSRQCVRLAAGAAPFSRAVNVARRHLRRRRRAARNVTRDVMRERRCPRAKDKR